jgi:NAD:arginine ADP-ribosyltransferase
LGNSGTRSIMSVKTFDAVNVKKFSAYKTENEVIVPPCSYFEVMDVADLGNGLTMIQVPYFYFWSRGGGR